MKKMTSGCSTSTIERSEHTFLTWLRIHVHIYNITLYFGHSRTPCVKYIIISKFKFKKNLCDLVIAYLWQSGTQTLYDYILNTIYIIKKWMNKFIYIIYLYIQIYIIFSHVIVWCVCMLMLYMVSVINFKCIYIMFIIYVHKT